MRQTLLYLIVAFSFFKLTAQSKIARDLMELNSYEGKQEYYFYSDVEIDSIEQLLSNSKQSDERLELLLFYLKRQFRKDISKGEQQAKEALSIARKDKKPLHEVLALSALATIYSLQIENNTSSLYLDSAFNTADNINDPVLKSSFYYTKYLIYLLREDHVKSINNFLKSVELVEKYGGEVIKNNKLRILVKIALNHNNYSLAEKTLNKINYNYLGDENKVKFLFNKASIYQIKNDTDSTLLYYNKAYQDFPNDISHSFIGDHMVKIGNLDSALQHYYKAISLKDPKGSYFDLLYVKVAGIYKEKGVYDSTEYYLKKCLEEAIRLGEKTNNVKSHARLASFYFEQQQYNKAKEHTTKAYEFAIQNQFIESLETITKILENLAAQEDQYDKAYQFAIENRYYLNELSQQEATKFLRVTEIERDLKTWSINQDKKMEKAENAKNLVVIIAAFFLLVSGMLYSMYRTKHKALQNQLFLGETIKEQNEEILSQGEELKVINEDLSSLNNKLESRITERTEELKIVNKHLSTYNQRLEQYANLTSHNLRAPLASIKGLLNLYNMQHINPEEKEMTVQYIRKSSEEMDRVIEELNGLMDVENVNMSDYEPISVSQLVDQTEKWIVNKVHQNVVINKYLDLEELYSVKHFIEPTLRELFLNAFNFRNSKKPLEITVWIAKKKNNIEIKIKDNGLGIDLNNHRHQIFKLHQRFHQQTNGRGIGLYLVKRQVEALNGTVTIDSQPDDGTCFTILLPKIGHMRISHSVA